HSSRQRSKGGWACLYHGFCFGQGRVGVVAHQGSPARRSRTADTATARRYLFLDKAKFPASFAADVDAEKAAFMADSQVPWGVEALSGTISQAAWRTKPSWYLVVTDDKMITLTAQRFMFKRAGSTVVEVAG